MDILSEITTSLVAPVETSAIEIIIMVVITIQVTLTSSLVVRLLKTHNNVKIRIMKHYRCGYCGTPTNEQGDPLSVGECRELTKEQLNNAELLCGYCCYKEQQESYITVT